MKFLNKIIILVFIFLNLNKLLISNYLYTNNTKQNSLLFEKIGIIPEIICYKEVIDYQTPQILGKVKFLNFSFLFNTGIKNLLRTKFFLEAQFITTLFSKKSKEKWFIEEFVIQENNNTLSAYRLTLFTGYSFSYLFKVITGFYYFYFEHIRNNFSFDPLLQIIETEKSIGLLCGFQGKTFEENKKKFNIEYSFVYYYSLKTEAKNDYVPDIIITDVKIYSIEIEVVISYLLKNSFELFWGYNFRYQKCLESKFYDGVKLPKNYYYINSFPIGIRYLF